MKKVLRSYLIATTGLCSITASGFATNVLTEAKAGYFYPFDDRFRGIYSGGGIYGIELSCQAWKSLHVFTSGSIFDHSGHTKALHTRTDVLFVPVGLGLKYFWTVDIVDIYLGAGALATYLHMHDHSPYVIEKNAKWGWGGIAKFGANINLPKSFFIDLFTDCNYTKVHFHDTNGLEITRNSVNLSGLTFGIGIGYKFGPKKQRSQTEKQEPSSRKSNILHWKLFGQ